MVGILVFILRFCVPYFYDYGFRFVGSDATNSFGNAYVDVSNGSFVMRFVSDKDQLQLSFIKDTTEAKEYSIDLVYQLVLGSIGETGLLVDRYGLFLAQYAQDIIDVFKDENWSNTQKMLEQYQEERSKRMWG